MHMGTRHLDLNVFWSYGWELPNQTKWDLSYLDLNLKSLPNQTKWELQNKPVQ